MRTQYHEDAAALRAQAETSFQRDLAVPSTEALVLFSIRSITSQPCIFHVQSITQTCQCVKEKNISHPAACSLTSVVR